MAVRAATVAELMVADLVHNSICTSQSYAHLLTVADIHVRTMAVVIRGRATAVVDTAACRATVVDHHAVATVEVAAMAVVAT